MLFGGDRDDQSSLLSGESDVTGPLFLVGGIHDQSLSFLGMSGVAEHPATGKTGDQGMA